jgi:ubiquinone/menaquinone biosynthesis C-methylase UbiE
LELHEAVEFIRPAVPEPRKGAVWADLGSGKGLFTRALAIILGPGNLIHAVDRSRESFEPFFNGNRIEFHQLDFSEGVLPFSALDGVLMANSLHFVQDKRSFLLRLRKLLRQNGQLVMVEYEQEKGNAWVPYPASSASLKALLTESGFNDIRFIGERQSIYQGRKMYACVATNA